MANIETALLDWRGKVETKQIDILISNLSQLKEEYLELQKLLLAENKTKKEQAETLGIAEKLIKRLQQELSKMGLKLKSHKFQNEYAQLQIARLKLLIAINKIIAKKIEEESLKEKLGKKLKVAQNAVKEWKRKARNRRSKYSLLKRRLRKIEKERDKKEAFLEEIRVQVLRARLCDTFLTEEEGGGLKVWKIYSKRVTDLANWLLERLPPTKDEIELINTPNRQRTMIQRLSSALYRLFPEHKKKST